jgi:hypothetical protein
MNGGSAVSWRRNKSKAEDKVFSAQSPALEQEITI